MVKGVKAMSMSRSSSIEFFERLRQKGIKITLENNRVAVLGKREILTPSLIEEIKAYREALRLILEKGTHQALCYGCFRTTTFYPTSEVMDVFRRWECGWKLWRREEGAYPDGTLRAIIQAFRGNVINRIPKEKGKPDDTV